MDKQASFIKIIVEEHDVPIEGSCLGQTPYAELQMNHYSTLDETNSSSLLL